MRGLARRVGRTLTQSELHRTAAVAAILVLVGVAAAAGVLVRRARVEGPRAGPVELVMDWEALRRSADEWDRPAEEVLAALAREGVTTLALTEWSAADLVAQGQGLLLSPVQLQMLARLEGGRPEPAAPTPAALSWLLVPGQEPVAVPARLPHALEYRVGFPREGWAAAARAGVAVMLRYGDGPRLVEPAGAQAPDAWVAGVAGYGRLEGVPLSRVSIFWGDELPPPEEAARLLGGLGAAVGVVEFGKVQPLRVISQKFDVPAVTVHSIRPDQLQELGPQAAAQRYTRAAVERSVRVLYLRPLESFEDTRQMVALVRDGLKAWGYRLGRVQPGPPFRGPGPWACGAMASGLAGLSLAGMLGWGQVRGWPWPRRRLRQLGLGAVALAVVLAAGAWAAQSLGWRHPASLASRLGLALAVSLVAPTAALGLALAVARGRVSPAEDRRRGTAGPWRDAGQVLAAAAVFVATAVAGGLLVRGLLSDQQFMVRLEVFRGVKLAHALPVAAAGLLALWALGQPQLWGEAAGSPVRWKDLVLGAVGLAAAGYYLARTGNELAPVWVGERWLRGWLESLLEVRPRSKEFLVGYPALAATLALWRAGLAERRPWLWALAAAAATVAAVSVVNSWAHVHTPVVITVWRVFNGLVAGAVTGAAAWWVVRRLLPWLGPLPAKGSAAPESRPVRVLRV